MDRKFLFDFLHRHSLAVLSTADSNCKPESAVVQFGDTENFEIIFDTIKTFRKYRNLNQNNHVSIVIGWDEDQTVQYEGQAFELDGDDLQKYKNLFFDKLPEVRQYESREGITYFKVVPTWIRYTDLRVFPWKTFEVTRADINF